MSSIKLGTACKKIGSGATPRGGKEVYLASGPYTLIRSQNVYNDGFSEGGLAFIDDDQAKKLDNVNVESGDVLLNITGDSVARVCQVPDRVLPARVNQHVAIIRPDPSVLHARFLRFFLSSPDMQQRMLALASAGATRNALTKGMIEDFDIPSFRMSEQVAIGSLLGMLEDKIRVNQERTKTLNATVRALFQHWIVDSEDSSSSEWTKKPVKELLADSIGGDWGKEAPDDKHTAEVAIIRGTDFLTISEGFVTDVPIRFVEPNKLTKRQLTHGDLIIEVSGGSPTQPTGRSLYVTQELLDRFSCPVISASFCRRFRATNKEAGLLLKCHLDYLYEQGGTWKYQNQSTGIANFQTTFFIETELITLPPAQLLKQFCSIIEPMIALANTNENLVLGRLIRLLLPRLMSRELTIKQAEEKMEALV